MARFFYATNKYVLGIYGHKNNVLGLTLLVKNGSTISVGGFVSPEGGKLKKKRRGGGGSNMFNSLCQISSLL
jgi:hypothetical protein